MKMEAVNVIAMRNSVNQAEGLVQYLEKSQHYAKRSYILVGLHMMYELTGSVFSLICGVDFHFVVSLAHSHV